MEFEASGYHYYRRKVTMHSKMTVEFLILPYFFDIEWDNQEEGLK